MATTQIALRMSDEAVGAIDGAVKRIHDVDDALGLRSDYIRDAALVAAAAEHKNRTLRAMVSRYLEVCRRARPRFTVPEWKLICDACNGLWLAEAWSVTGIPLEVSDGVRLNDLSAKWLLGDKEGAAVTRARAAEIAGGAASEADLATLRGVRERGQLLVRRLAELTYAELVAIADVVERFWSAEDGKVPGEDGWTEERIALP